ncbi:MAG: hypothetical protein KGH98_04820 [Candidatus Micrarchaeota archaeon]|nr:hypothetical protein [Candidatus Micrarchaeota archaeon]
MEWYDGALGPLEDSWAKSMPLGSRERLVGYYYLAVRASAGLDMSYFIPDIEGVSSKDRELAIGMRGRSGDFLERTGRVMELSLERLYPALGRYSKYISKGELESEAIPTMEELIERDRHYIFYNHRLYTKISLEDFAKGIGVEIRREKEPSGTLSEIRGQTAMKGIAAGKVRIITRKDELRGFIEGEILVAPMTTADYLPAMQKASAIITDEGGITCHAAIVAREIGKPCIIGTRFATKVLKTGDLVELDADKGIISITHSKQSPHSK